jgi:hypothetical protein
MKIPTTSDRRRSKPGFWQHYGALCIVGLLVAGLVLFIRYFCMGQSTDVTGRAPAAGVTR